MTLFTFIIVILIHLTNGQIDLSKCIMISDECPNPNITFWHYTRKTQNKPFQIAIDDDSINKAKFITNVPTKVIIHGYTGHKDFDPNPQIRPAYFKNGEYNVISVDYGQIAKEPCYIHAAKNVPIVGKCTAQLLDELVTRNIIPFDSIHVVGFSLGAQVAGATGYSMKSGKLTRITGLDPAMPLFVTPDPNGKLDKTDAVFVDVIHTNALDKGKLEASGDIDFYVNGGMSQPGCDKAEVPASCSHARAPEYFSESINSRIGFYGKKCYSWFLYIIGWCNFDDDTEEVIMGEFTPNMTEGLFFVNTDDKSPYARGKWTDGDTAKYNETMQNQTMSDLENQSNQNSVNENDIDYE